MHMICRGSGCNASVIYCDNSGYWVAVVELQVIGFSVDRIIYFRFDVISLTTLYLSHSDETEKVFVYCSMYIRPTSKSTVYSQKSTSLQVDSKKHLLKTGFITSPETVVHCDINF